MESKTGKSQMIAIQLSFVPGAGGDLIEGVKLLLFSFPFPLVLGMILLNESHTLAFMDGIRNWQESYDSYSAVLCPWCWW